MVAISPSMIGILAGHIAEFVLSRFVSQKFASFIAKINQEDLGLMADLMKSGKLIDRSTA